METKKDGAGKERAGAEQIAVANEAN